ncbi:MAG: energy-coupling factor ABC transporter permease [Bryobacteraceae bacterium]
MHIPDGFLSPPVIGATAAASAAAVGWASRRAQQDMEEGSAPLLGVLGAFVFAAQMINFPVGAGTTGHLLGAGLLAITLGPAAGIVVMTAILVIQALIFQDGGILALGANVFNMAVVGTAAAWLPYRLLGSGKTRDAAVFLAGFCSVLASSTFTLLSLAASGISIPSTLAGVSLGLFGVNAIIEGLISAAVVRVLARMNPQWTKPAEPLSAAALTGLAVAAAALATGAVMLAARAPDGLESLAEQIGIAGRAKVLLAAPLADYQAASVEHPWVSQALAGAAGILVTFAVVFAAARLAARRRGA